MKFTPFRISLIYLVFATLWIATTDTLLEWTATSEEMLSLLQTVKGVFYVTITAVALYWMIKSYEKYVSKSNIKLQNQKRSLDIALDSANMSVWEYDPFKDSFVKSENHNSMFGYDEDYDMKLEDVYQRIHPEDLDKYKENVARTFEERNQFDVRYRVLDNEGTIKWLWSKGEPRYTNGQIDTVNGVTIDITANKELESELDFERERFEKLIDKIPVLVILYNPDIEVTTVNKEFEKVLGWSNHDLQNEDIINLAYPDPDYREQVKKEMSQPYGEWREYSVRSKNGDIRKQLWSNIRLSDNTIMGMGYDITERSEMESQLRQNEEWVSLTTKSANIGKWEWHPQTGEVKIDEIWADLVGYTIEELEPISIKTWDKLVHPEDYPVFVKAVEDYIEGRKSIYECEVRMKHKDGHWVYILDRGKAVEWDEDGRPTRLVGTHIDITDRKVYEETLQYQASLLSHVSDAVLSLDKEFRIVSWNKAAEKIYGTTSEEAIGKHIDSVIETSYEPGVTGESLYRDLVETGFWQGVLYQTGANGKSVKILSSIVLIRNKDGDVGDIVAVNRDMTERLKYERENRLLANVFMKSKTALAVIDNKTGELLRLNNAYADLFGYQPEEMEGLNVNEKLYTDSEKEKHSSRIKVLNDQGYISFESKLRCKDGSEFYGLVNLSIVNESDTDQIYQISTVQDISKLKSIQNQISRERQRFELAANTVSDVVWEWNPVEQDLWWGEGIESVMGYKREQYEGDLEFWQNHIHEEDRERVIKSMNVAENQNETHWENEYKFIAADGSIRRVRDNAVLIYDEDGELNRIIGAMVDVTQMLEYQEALSRERNRFELIARSANDVLYDFNIDSGEVWWSEGWVYRFGYDEPDVENNLEWWEEKIHPDDREKTLTSLLNAISERDESWSEMYRLKNGKDEYRIVMDKGYFIKDDAGKPINLIGTITDITTDELAKQELKKSEEQYRLLFERSPLPMYIYNPDTLTIIAVNKAAVERYGYTPKEFMKMKIYELHPEEELEAIMDEISKSLKKTSTGFDTWNQVTKDGERLIVEISGSRITYKDKVQRLVIAKDVTEQRVAEKQLKESEEQYRLLFEQNPVPMWIYDPDTYYFTASNNASREKYGYSKEEFLEMTIFELHDPTEAEEVKRISNKNRKSKEITFTESRHLTKDGRRLLIEISASDIVYKNKVQRLVIANDITEQRKAEERAISAILEGEERERQRIAKELHDGLGQYLSAANMNLETVYEDADDLSNDLSATFKNGLQLLNHAISETRNISQNLLPKAIQDYGLELALEALINQLKVNNDINFYLFQKLDGIDIPDNIQINLYRIAQEAISNAIRHGKPKNINVQNIYSMGEILLTIEDDGCGFDVNQIQSEGGIGLQSIKTRVAAMAANMDIISTPGRGTIVSVIIPIQKT